MSARVPTAPVEGRRSSARPEMAERTSRLAWALAALAAGLATNSVVGPLLFDLVDYPLSETLRNQTIGLDAVTLIVVAPLAALAARWVARGRPLGSIVALVVGSYTSYMFVQYVVGPDYDHYPGTLPLQIGLFTLGWLVSFAAWNTLSNTPPPPLETIVRHSYALFALAGFVVLRYLPSIPAAFANEQIPEESLDDPAMFWSIVLMDLGVFVPAVVVVAIGLRRGASWAIGGLYVAVGWFVLVTLAVLAMSIVMVINDDAYGSSAQVGLFALTAGVVVTYAYRLFGQLRTTADAQR